MDMGWLLIVPVALIAAGAAISFYWARLERYQPIAPWFTALLLLVMFVAYAVYGH